MSVSTSTISQTRRFAPANAMNDAPSISDPYSLLFNYSLSYEEKIALLKEWRDERTRFLMECCRDMDYLNDGTMQSILQALHAIRKEPRRHQ